MTGTELRRAWGITSWEGFVVLVSLVAFPGCIDVGEENPPTPPLATMETPLGIQAGNVLLSYALADQNMDEPTSTCTVSVEYSEDSGITWGAATLLSTSAGSISGNVITLEVQANLPATAYTFVWDSLADLGAGYQTDIRVRITPNDGRTDGASASTGDFAVWNFSPWVSVADPGGAETGEMTLSFVLGDAEGDVSSVLVEYSTDGGGTFSPATVISSSSGAIVGSTVSGLVTTPTGLSYDLVWDSFGDGVGKAAMGLARIRITPNDGFVDGVPAETIDFFVDNTVAASWSAGQTASGTLTNARTPRIAVDAAGAVHVVWADDSAGSAFDVYYNSYWSGIWSGVVNLSNSAADSIRPDVCVDGAGNVAVVWAESAGANYDVYWNYYSGAAWSGPQAVAAAAGGTSPAVAADALNNLHLVWQTDGVGAPEVLYSTYTGAWSAAVNISNTAGDSMTPDVATLQRAAGEIVVRCAWSDNSFGSWEIFWDWYDPTAGPPAWQGTDWIGPFGGHGLKPRLAADDPNDDFYLTWMDDEGETSFDIRTAQAGWAAGGWGTRRNVSNDPVLSDAPDIARDPNNVTYVVWASATKADFEICYSFSLDDGNSWSPPVNVSNTAGGSWSPSIVADSANKLHLVWEEDVVGGKEILYAER